MESNPRRFPTNTGQITMDAWTYRWTRRGAWLPRVTSTVVCSHCHNVLTYLHIPVTIHQFVYSFNLWTNRWNLNPVDWVLTLYKSQSIREHTGGHNVVTWTQPVNEPHTWVLTLCLEQTDNLSRDQSPHKLYVCAGIISIEIKQNDTIVTHFSICIYVYLYTYIYIYTCIHICTNMVQESWKNAQKLTHAENCNGVYTRGKGRGMNGKFPCVVWCKFPCVICPMSMRRLGNTKRLQVIISNYVCIYIYVYIQV